MPQSTRLIALRHGETAWNVDSRIQGQLDIGLNATGHWQAQRLGQALAGEPITAIYASDLSRAWDTAQHVARATGVQVQPEPGLRERCFGVFQGRTFAEVELESPELARRWRQRANGPAGWAASAACAAATGASSAAPAAGAAGSAGARAAGRRGEGLYSGAFFMAWRRRWAGPGGGPCILALP